MIITTPLFSIDGEDTRSTEAAPIGAFYGNQHVELSRDEVIIPIINDYHDSGYGNKAILDSYDTLMEFQSG
jgi:hypothetical protein